MFSFGIHIVRAFLMRWLRFDLASLWMFFAMPVVLLIAIVTPPFQVPDEPQHFFRSVQLSEGDLLGVRVGDLAGGMLPGSYATFVERWLGTRESHAVRKKKIYEPAMIEYECNFLVNPSEREFVEFSGSVRYSPLGYIPQVIGVSLARALNLGPIFHLYCARVLNGIVAVLIIWYGLGIAGGARDCLFVASCLPMSLYLFASASPDAMLIACAFVYMAWAVRIIESKSINGAQTSRLVASALVVVSLKPVYAPLILIPLLGLCGRSRLLSRGVAMGIIPAGIGSIAFIIWTRYTTSLALPSGDRGVGFPADGLVSWLIAFARHLARTIWYRSEDYLRQMIGVFGWLTNDMPNGIYVLISVSAVLVIITGRRVRPRFSTQVRVGLFLAVAVATMMIFVSLYVFWTKAGDWSITGVQGRYFIPLLPLLLLAGRSPGTRAMSIRTALLLRAFGLAGCAFGCFITPVLVVLNFWRM